MLQVNKVVFSLLVTEVLLRHVAYLFPFNLNRILVASGFIISFPFRLTKWLYKVIIFDVTMNKIVVLRFIFRV